MKTWIWIALFSVIALSGCSPSSRLVGKWQVVAEDLNNPLYLNGFEFDSDGTGIMYWRSWSPGDVRKIAYQVAGSNQLRVDNRLVFNFEIAGGILTLHPLDATLTIHLKKVNFDPIHGEGQ